MRRALELAGAGWGRVHPNPLVGAVLVRDGVVVGEGAHREFGGPHAEIEALQAAGSDARGATLYVTLEPCAHHGKTPPCTHAVQEAGVRRVVYALADPHPQAAGGARVLKEAGVQVTGGVEEAAARSRNALFLQPIERGRPFLALKYGMSLDARLGMEGRTTRVTGDAAHEAVHRLRAGFDAVMVGARTAAVDDPRLTVRDGPPPRVPPTRVVVDPGAALSPRSALARSAREVPVLVLCAPEADEERVRALEGEGVQVVPVPRTRNGLDLRQALDRMDRLGITTVLCEGGGRLGSGLLRAGLVDRLYLFIAPTLLGPAAVPAFPGAPGQDGPDQLGSEAADPPRFQFTEVRQVGDDALLMLDRRD